MGVVVPLGLRSTTARKAYLNLRNVPTFRVVKVQKKRTHVVTKTVERKLPRKTVVRGHRRVELQLRHQRQSGRCRHHSRFHRQPERQSADPGAGRPRGRHRVVSARSLGGALCRAAVELIRCAERQRHLYAAARQAADRAGIHTPAARRGRTCSRSASTAPRSTSQASAPNRSRSPRRRSAGRAPISASATSSAATRATKPIAIMPISRCRCRKRSPTFRARSPRSGSLPLRSAGVRRSRICRCRRRAVCRVFFSRTIRAGGRIWSLSAAAASIGLRTRSFRWGPA